MEFKRIEVKKVLRYREFITDPLETKTIFENLFKYHLRFSMKARDVGQTMTQCSVLAVGDSECTIFSPLPKKVQTVVAFEEIDMIEVESGNSLVSQEDDDGGRWSRLMSGGAV
jgi:hypothetical protein